VLNANQLDMRVNSRPHYYRVHDNGWLSIVTPAGDGGFVASAARGEGTRLRRTAEDLTAAQRVADAAVPSGHVCSGGCTSWFKIRDPKVSVDHMTMCPKDHAASLSYTVGDVLLRLNTLSFWCLQCGRSWPATDEDVHRLVMRIVRDSG
jgi:hypothetical protein